ncbi:MAG: hypothetical protein V8T12_12110 [Parabacteroides johnsonii]
MWATASILLSIALQLLGMHFGFVTLTAPFVVAVWIIFKRRYVKTILFPRLTRDRIKTGPIKI